MAKEPAADADKAEAARGVLYWLALALVLIGLLNATPGIPGLDDWAKSASGNPWFVIRKFPFEYYYPLFFALMMLTVALKHSMWRDWSGRGQAPAGLRPVHGPCTGGDGSRHLLQLHERD